MRTLRTLVVALVLAPATVRASVPNGSCATAMPLTALPFEASFSLRPDPYPSLPVCGGADAAWYVLPVAEEGTLVLQPHASTVAQLEVSTGTCENPSPGECVSLAVFHDGPLRYPVCAGRSYLLRIAVPTSPPGFPSFPDVAFTASFLSGSPDLDDDGVDDCIDGCPKSANPEQGDADGDGVQDACDVCPTISDPGQADHDFDGSGDACDGCPDDGNKQAPGACGCDQYDFESDGDGIPNCIDDCPFVGDPEQLDADGDGAGDACDACPADADRTTAGVCGCAPEFDPDGDGTPSCIDACPDDPAKTRAGDCGCGQPELDPDGDLVSSCVDTCPEVANADQSDLDGDGIGDRCACAAGRCLAGDEAGVGECGVELLPASGTTNARSSITCVDGTSCDEDPAPGACSIPLALCFAVDDPGLPRCTPASLRSVALGGAPDAATLLALATLPGARATDARTVLFDRAPSGPICTPPFAVALQAGERALEVVAHADGSGRDDRDRFVVRCERGRP